MCAARVTFKRPVIVDGVEFEAGREYPVSNSFFEHWFVKALINDNAAVVKDAEGINTEKKRAQISQPVSVKSPVAKKSSTKKKASKAVN